MARRRRSSHWRFLDAIVDSTDANYREAALTWQRLGPWLDVHDRRSAAAIVRHPRKVWEFLALARGYVPAGWLVEVSLHTLAGGRMPKATYERTERMLVRGKTIEKTRRITDRRPLYVKIGVSARAALPIAEHERAVRHAIERGVVDVGFTLHYADWDKGRGAAVNSGSIRRDIAVELVAFWGALHSENTVIRVEMVERESER